MVKRYATKQDFTHEYMMSDDPDGRYVDFVAYDALSARLAEARGCFDAALFEGWLDALANGDIERIRDLWTRRISFAMEAVTADSAPVAFWDCDCGQVNDDPTCIRCGATPTVPVAPEAK